MYFFFSHIFLSSSKRCTETWNPSGLELNRPSTKGTRLLFEVIKAIIILNPILGFQHPRKQEEKGEKKEKEEKEKKRGKREFQ